MVTGIIQNLTTPKASEETIEKHCYGCRKAFTVPKWGIKSYEVRCHDCIEKLGDEEERLRQQQLEQAWLRKCPKQFLETDVTKLPCQESVRRALDWKYGSIGLLLHGPTGTGKTRTGWLVLRNMHLKRKSYQILNSLAGLEYAAKFSQSAAVVQEWVEGLIECDVLFMDDPFKNKLTDSFEGIIFSVIDRRTENGRPTVLTANDTGATLSDRMTNDRGEPLVRRLREFCLPLPFNPPPK
jgi:DNA replication protein DnaC